MATRKKATEGVTPETKKRTTRKSKSEDVKKLTDNEVEVLEPDKIIGENGEEIDPKTIILTPADYFEKIKGLQQQTTDEELQQVLDYALSKMEKFKILKQTEAASILNEYINMFKKEIEIIHAGFTTYVLKNDIEYYMNHLSDKAVFCCELTDYPREIPDEIFDKIKDHMDLFDHIYIVFTDYTQKVSKHIDKKTREKDPIMFGAVDRKGSSYKPIVGPRYYFIGDWVDEFCDLTLEQMIENFKADEKYKDKEIDHKLSVPKNATELTSAMNVFINEENLNITKSTVNYVKDEKK